MARLSSSVRWLVLCSIMSAIELPVTSPSGKNPVVRNQASAVTLQLPMPEAWAGVIFGLASRPAFSFVPENMNLGFKAPKIFLGV